MAFDRYIIGTAADDVLDDLSLGGTSFIRGLKGNDTIVSVGVGNRTDGGAGDDKILVVGGMVLDGDGDDLVTVEATARLTVVNGAGNDYFTTVSGHAALADIVIHDGAGSDQFFIESDGHIVHVYADISDPAGNDAYGAFGSSLAVISYAGTTQGVTIDMNGSAFGAEIGDDSIGGFTKAIGGSGDDTMFAAASGSILLGGSGNDELWGSSGKDRLIGGDGNDNIFDYTGGTVDINTGGGLNNVIVSGAGGKVVLGDGTNLLEIRNSGADPAGTLKVVLTGLDNSIVGDDGNETILIAGEGWASIDIGENGTIIANTTIHHFEGSLTSQSETVQLKGRSFFVFLDGGDFVGIDRVITGHGNDVMGGSATAFNNFETGGGADEIICRADLTVIFAGAGDDLVHGGTGEARIDLGTGLDRVFCGSGMETVAFDSDSSDEKGRTETYLIDFTLGVDKIRLETGADIAAFLALGQNTTISSIDGVRFDTTSGDMLFLSGISLDQISVADFIV